MTSVKHQIQGFHFLQTRLSNKDLVAELVGWIYTAITHGRCPYSLWGDLMRVMAGPVLFS